MHKSVASAVSDMEKVVASRSKYKGNYSYETYSTFYTSAENMSQETLNLYYNRRHADEVSGTCSLVAMTMMAYTVKESKSYNLNKTKHQIFKELKDAYLEVSGEQEYTGEQGKYFEDTIEKFYLKNGISVDVNFVKTSSNVNESFCNDIEALSVLNIKGADVVYSGKSFAGWHSVLYVGCYAYKTIYKEQYLKIFKKDVEKFFLIYVVCDGWTNSNNGKIGSNYQLIVFNDTASVEVTEIPMMLDNIIAEAFGDI